MVKTVAAVRYVTPLREGSSMPAIIEADDGQQYVMKFLGAGQGRKALIAELVAGEIGRALGLNIPDLAFVELDPALGPSEPDPEIFDLLRASAGLNLGMAFLPHALAYHALLQPTPSPELASAVVWFDAYVTNVDRTPRNPNILLWQKSLWLIDHGACLFFHHDWQGYLDKARSPFPYVKDHILLPFAGPLGPADAAAKLRLNESDIDRIVSLIPDVWLEGEPFFPSLAEHRLAYSTYLKSRLEESHVFVEEADHARAARV